MHENGIPSEAVIVACNEYSSEEWSAIIGAQVTTTDNFEASVYGKSDISGVKKDHGEVFSKPVNKDGNSVLNESRAQVADLINKLT